MLYFWLLVLAHGLADFILQTKGVSAAKSANKWQGYARHGLAIFLCTFAAVHFFGWKIALLSAGLVTGVHLSLDWLKNVGRAYYAKKKKQPRVQGLLIDQCLHILTLFLMWRLVDSPVDTAVAGFYAEIFSPMGLPGTEKIVSGLAVYTFVVFGGAVLIRFTLDQIFPPGYIIAGQLKPDSTANSESRSVAAGKYIGILERFLIMTLTVTGNISAIGVVFAAKSIARFSEFSNKHFAEYYLVGTLLSVVLALAGGIALAQIWMQG